MEEKSPLLLREEQKLTLVEGQNTLLLPGQRPSASGREAVAKTACSLGGAGNPPGPGSYTTPKHSSATPGGTRNSLLPKTNPRCRLALAILGEEQEHWGGQALRRRYTGLPNTEGGPSKYRTPVTPTTGRAPSNRHPQPLLGERQEHRERVLSERQKAEWIRDTEENPPAPKTPF